MPKQQKNLRQVRYKMHRDTNDILSQESLQNYWTFFILNEKRELDIIEQKIINYFSSSHIFAAYDEFTKLETGILVKDRSLRGRLVTLKTNTRWLNDAAKIKIYNSLGKWHEDRLLHPHMNDVQLDNYASRLKL